MTPDPDLVTRRAEIVAEIEESNSQLDRGEFVTEDQLRARSASRREQRKREAYEELKRRT